MQQCFNLCNKLVKSHQLDKNITKHYYLSIELHKCTVFRTKCKESHHITRKVCSVAGVIASHQIPIRDFGLNPSGFLNSENYKAEPDIIFCDSFIEKPGNWII